MININMSHTTENEEIHILMAVYGVAESVTSIEEVYDDYLVYIFDDQYNLLNILTPYEL